MTYITKDQALNQIDLYIADLGKCGLSKTEKLSRLNGFLTCMCHSGELDPYLMGDLYTDYENRLANDNNPALPLGVQEFINRFKIYLAHDQYQRDKRTMMDGYLMALQHQRLIDPWQAYQISQEYEKELANA